ncbi:acetyl-CoA carboxylase, carboxyltransferase subunit beta [Nocardiopsis coralliicola]
MTGSPPIPEWVACRRCRALVYGKRFQRELLVCPECGDHAPVGAMGRLAQLLDEGSTAPLAPPPTPDDPLGFVDTVPYRDRLEEARRATGLDEAVVCARGVIRGFPVVAAAMDFRFLGGSLGTAVGRRITHAADTALADRTPLVLVTASGGARMQEGILALMQMAATSGALAELDEAGVLTVSVVTDPTYAGVAASFATLSDIIIAEPGARMGFTGPRVIEQTIGERLPEGFQTAEALIRHGLIDAIRPRSDLRSTLGQLLSLSAPAPAAGGGPGAALADVFERNPESLAASDPWERVGQARSAERPTTLDYISVVGEDFVELHGDRASGDSPAIVGGMARVGGRAVMVIGHQKGHGTAELIARDFGMPTPDGYRKAARLLRLAAKLGLPVLTLIDTPGAHPGVEGERMGQAFAIADNLRLMSRLPVPIVAVVTGEGGSGGALALGVADRVLCFPSSIYSVISPEGCAAILWRDRGKAPAAAAALGLDAGEQLRVGAVDAIVPEPDAGVQSDLIGAAVLLERAVGAAFDELAPLPAGELLRRRRRRFRRFNAAAASGEERGAR